MAQTVPCPICTNPAEAIAPKDDRQEIFCPRCGVYKATGSLLAVIGTTPLGEPQRAYASSWIRERTPATPADGSPPFVVTSEHHDVLRTVRPPSVPEQADRLFAEIRRRTPMVGQTVTIRYDDLMYQAVSWSANADELYFLSAAYLVDERNFIQPFVDTNPARPLIGRISPGGWEYLQTGGARARTQGFIAMWFDPATAELRELGIKPAIEAAGYRAFLVDESLRNRSIDSEIVANIRRSRFMIADLHYGSSVPRGSVYFEAGYAMGHNIPVYWTCHEDDLVKKLIHFDVRQYVFTAWGKDPWEMFARKLASIIEANEGEGPFKAPNRP